MNNPQFSIPNFLKFRLMAILPLLPMLALAHGLINEPPPFLSFLLLFFGLFLLPGGLLLRYTSGVGPIGILEAVPLAFALGLSVFAVEGIFAFLLGLSYGNLCVLSAVVSTGLACLPKVATVRLRPFWRPEWGILLISLGIAALAFYLGGYNPTGNDPWYHIAKIRRMAGIGQAIETDVLFLGSGVSPSYGYNIWHLALAVMTDLSNADAFAAWFFMIPLLAFLQVPAYYAFARELFDERSLGFCAAFLFVVFILLDAMAMSWIASPVPFMVAHHLLFFPAMTFALRSTKERGPILPIAAGFVGGSAFMVHAFTPFYLLIAVCGFALMIFIFRKNRGVEIRSLLMAGLCTAAFAVPFGLVRSKTFMPVGTYYLHVEANKALWLTDHVYVVHPRYMRRMPVRIAGFLLFPLVLGAIKRRRWALYCASGMVLPPLVMFNPLLVPLIAEFASLTFVSRLLVLFPAVEVCTGVFCCSIVPMTLAWWRRAPRGRWLALIGITALLAVTWSGAEKTYAWLLANKDMATSVIGWGSGLLVASGVALVAFAAARREQSWPPWNPIRLPPAPRLAMGLTVALTALAFTIVLPPMVRNYRNPKHHLHFQQGSSPGGVFGFLKSLPGPAVILADDTTSSKIPALTGHYIVATAYSHDPIRDWTARKKTRDGFLSGDGDWDQAISRLRSFDVGYVLAEESKITTRAMRRLDGNPMDLIRCYREGGYIVWKVQPSISSRNI